MNGFVDIYTIIFLVIAVVDLPAAAQRARPAHRQRAAAVRPLFAPRKPAGRRPDDKVIDLSRRAADRAAPAPSPSGRRRRRGAHQDASPRKVRRSTTASRRSPPPTARSTRRIPRRRQGRLRDDRHRLCRGRPQDAAAASVREVYDGFVTAIAQREERGETIEFKFVGIDKAEITGAARQGQRPRRSPSASCRSWSRRPATRTARSIDGDPVHVGDVTDIWTFARETTFARSELEAGRDRIGRLAPRPRIGRRWAEPDQHRSGPAHA